MINALSALTFPYNLTGFSNFTISPTAIGQAVINGSNTFLNITAPVPGTSYHTNPLTGLPGDPTRLTKRPVAVVVNNRPVARTQYGLSAADVVYEYVMDGWYVTRFTAIYYGNEVERIGPVRSARLINEQIAGNENLLLYRYIERLSPNIRVMMVPTDNPFILNLESLQGEVGAPRGQ